MSHSTNDQFLGEWTITEYVYSPQSKLIGTVNQQRKIFSESGRAETLLVEQHCKTSDDLCEHPMAAFAGDFRFRLQKEGRERYYLGPDVQGFGQSFGDIFLCGEGIWPRFGYNFRSWSIRLSETRQLTGGVFFRGAAVEAVIFGIGHLLGTEAKPSPVAIESRIHGGAGKAAQFDLASDTELDRPLTRQLLGSGNWLETGPGQEETFLLEPRGSAWLLSRSNSRSVGSHSLGMAHAYGPLLYWETHGKFADSTVAIEINDPYGTQQFSIRRHYLCGKLVSIDGLQFSE